MNIYDLINEYKRYALREKGIKYRSYKAIRSAVTGLCIFHNTNTLRKFETQHIRVYLSQTSQERGWSAKTYRNQRQSLLSFYNWMILTGKCTTNPVLTINKPRLPDLLPRALTKEQATTFLSAVRWIDWLNDWQALRNEMIVAIFLFTGIRLSELLHLKRSDIRLDEDFIFICQGKMSKDRLVPIHAQLMPILRKYLIDLKDRKSEGEWLFTGLNSGIKLYPKNINQIFRRVSHHVGFRCTPHMLRHTFGRLAVEAGLGLYKIKEIMGHSSVSTTQIYLSISSKNLKESFQKIDIL